MVSQHMHLDGRPCHQTAIESVQILNWKDDWITRGIRESIYIRMLHPNLNADGRRHHLPPILDNLLEVSCNIWSQEAA